MAIPTLQFAPETLMRAQGGEAGIRVAIFDVDGVLTDGSLYISDQGESLKVFNSLDGHGLKLLVRSGIVPVVITGRDSPALRRRLADVGITQASYGVEEKLGAAEAWLAQLGVAWDAVAAMGDDWPDLPVMERAAFACAPANAHVEVRAMAHHVTRALGGAGAAREFCDVLLMAAGHYVSLLAGRAALDRA